jgi:hypothetical protein
MTKELIQERSATDKYYGRRPSCAESSLGLEHFRLEYSDSIESADAGKTQLGEHKEHRANGKSGKAIHSPSRY